MNVDDEESGPSGLIFPDEGLSGSADEDWFNRMGDFNGRFSLLVVRTCVFFFLAASDVCYVTLASYSRSKIKVNSNIRMDILTGVSGSYGSIYESSCAARKTTATKNSGTADAASQRGGWARHCRKSVWSNPDATYELATVSSVRRSQDEMAADSSPCPQPH